MPRLLPQTAPPPDYYASNLRAVVRHVREHSNDLLGSAQPHARALSDLSQDAERLIARLIMRTTAVVRVDSLNYAEVDDRDSAIKELAQAKLIGLNRQASATHLLERLKVAELKALFPELVVKKDRKTDLMGRVLSAYTDEMINQRCLVAMQWITVDEMQALRRLQLAYFGDLYRDLTEFVMRDLGMSEFEDYELGDTCRAFSSIAEFDDYLELSALQTLAPQRRSQALPWLFDHPAIKASVLGSRSLRRRRDKLLNDWGRDFERSNLLDQAHACYSRSTAHPARERRVRLYAKSEDHSSQRALLNEMRAEPWSSEEALFAARFDGIKVKSARQVVPPWQETLWSSHQKQMPRVELRTALQLSANGGRAWHTENALLQSLLGLAFWDIVFTPEPGMFTHPFQSGPRDLYWPDFRAKRSRQIAERLEECADLTKLWSRIYRTVEAKAGRMTRLVHWGLVTHNNCEILKTASVCFSGEQLHRLFDYMLNDLGAVRSGMPDLFVAYGAGSFELVEVKGPSDQLQPNQRIWLQSLSDIGIPCRVVKHRFVAPGNRGS